MDFVTPAAFFFRTLPLCVVAPFEPFARLPMLARVAFAVALAWLLTSALGANAKAPTLTWPALAQEFLLGATLAFSLHAAVAALSFLGHLIEQQMGMAAGAVLDPAHGQMSSVISELLKLGFVVAALGMDVHHDLLKALVHMNLRIPPGTDWLLTPQVFSILGAQLALGFVTFAPVIIGLWLVDLVLALASKAMPQANIYFVSLPIKIAVGLLLLAWVAARAAENAGEMFGEAILTWPSVVEPR